MDMGPLYPCPPAILRGLAKYSEFTKFAPNTALTIDFPIFFSYLVALATEEC